VGFCGDGFSVDELHGKVVGFEGGGEMRGRGGLWGSREF
jgi:hypothetical protein